MEAWREELYLQHGLFDNLRAKYKTVSGNAKKSANNVKDNIKKAVNTTANNIKNKASIGNNNREWKNHKYIRKEGNRYIYKENPKSSKLNNSNIVDTHQRDWERRKTRDFKNLREKVSSTPLSYGREAKKEKKEVEDTILKYGIPMTSLAIYENEYTSPVDGNKKKETRTVSINYKIASGKQWLDSFYLSGDHGQNGREDIYVYEYGKLSQIKDKGKSFINKGKLFINKLFSN